MPRKRSWGKLVEVDAGTQYVLRGDTVVAGRLPANDIVLKESYVSGKHFTLSKVGNGGEQVLLTDNSSNGTFQATDAENMDQGRLTAKTSVKLGHGHLIGIGPKPNVTPPCFWTFQVTSAPLEEMVTKIDSDMGKLRPLELGVDRRPLIISCWCALVARCSYHGDGSPGLQTALVGSSVARWK